jgi:hypothetical protein
MYVLLIQILIWLRIIFKFNIKKVKDVLPNRENYWQY